MPAIWTCGGGRTRATDPLKPTRNRIRQEVLPWIEQTIAPGARRHLVELAELARESEQGWEARGRANSGWGGDARRRQRPRRAGSRSVLHRPGSHPVFSDPFSCPMESCWTGREPVWRSSLLPKPRAGGRCSCRRESGSRRNGTACGFSDDQQPPPDRLLTIAAAPAGTGGGVDPHRRPPMACSLVGRMLPGPVAAPRWRRCYGGASA